MNTNVDKRRRKLIELLKDEEYRKAFISESIDAAIPFQIQAIREQRGWSQEELGANMDGKKMAQAAISRFENPSYPGFTLKTLKKLACALKVGLMVRFVPLSELVEWELNLSTESLNVIAYDEDPYFNEVPRQGKCVAADLIPKEPERIISMDRFKKRDIPTMKGMITNQQGLAPNPFGKADRPLQRAAGGLA